MEAKGEDGTPSDSTTEDDLIRSCENGDSEAIRRLIKADVDINYQTWFNGEKRIYLFKTQSDSHPAWYYVEVDRGKQWRFEQDNGKPSARNPEFYGRVVKHGQGEHPSKDIEEEMNEYKSSLAKDKTIKDLTPLHVTVLHGHVEIAEKLLDDGADPSIRDKFGYSPVELAASKGDMRMIQLFQKKNLLKDRQQLKQIAADNEQKNLIKYLEEEDLIESAQRFVSADVQALSQYLLSITQDPSAERLIEIGRNPEMRANIRNEIRSFGNQIQQLQAQLEQEKICDPEEVKQNLSEAVTDELALVIGSSTEEQHDMEDWQTLDIE